MYFELFIAAALLCLGQIVFGRLEERARGRRMKTAALLGPTALLSHLAGWAAALAWVLGGTALGLAAHRRWTRRNGIRFFSPEPWDGSRDLRRVELSG